MTSVDKLEGLLDGVHKAVKLLEAEWNKTEDSIKKDFQEWMKKDPRANELQSISLE